MNRFRGELVRYVLPKADNRVSVPDLLDKLIPPSRNYGHEQAWHDGNGHSHLQATLLGPSLTVPVASGKPDRKMVGTAMICFSSTSAWNRAPSMET